MTRAVMKFGMKALGEARSMADSVCMWETIGKEIE
jgi:hypothetical protein